MHAPPETERPAALGEVQRATGQKEGHLSVPNQSASRKLDRPQTDERLLKTDTVAHSREKVRPNG